MSRNKFADRRLFFYFLFGSSALLLLITLFWVQVIDDSYKLSADNNVIKAVTLYPERGYIFDRNNNLLVENEPYYDLMIIPKDLKEIDTIEFCKILKIEKGNLSIGNDADFCIVDIYKPWIVKKEKLMSKSKNTSIDDRKLQGKVMNTFVKGEELFKN